MRTVVNANDERVIDISCPLQGDLLDVAIDFVRCRFPQRKPTYTNLIELIEHEFGQIVTDKQIAQRFEEDLETEILSKKIQFKTLGLI